MGLLRSIASGFLTFILVPLIVAFLFINNFTGTILDQNKFLGTLKDNKTYSAISSDILPSLIVSNISNENNPQGLPKDVVNNVVGAVDKEKLATDLERLVTDAYRYTTAQTSTLETKIDLQPYIKSLQTQLKPAFTQYYQSLPICTDEQAVQNEQGDLNCQLKGVSADQAASRIGIDETINSLATSAPKTITITKDRIIVDPPLGGKENNSSTDKATSNAKKSNQLSLEHIRNISGAARPASTGLLAVIAILLALLAAVHLPKLSSILRSLAWVLVSASIIPLILACVFLFFVHAQTVRQSISTAVEINTRSNYQETVLKLATNNLFELGQKIFQGIGSQALILIIIGAICFGIALWWDRRNKKLEKEPLKEPGPIIAKVDN